MKMTVTNKQVLVGEIEIQDVARSSLVLIGDAEVISSSSIFDTPADSLVISPVVPLPAKSC